MSIQQGSMALMNQFPKRTGIGRYSEALFAVVEDKVLKINLDMWGSEDEFDNLPGLHISGALKKYHNIFTYFVNMNFQTLAFRHKLKNLLSDVDFIHYLDPGITPVRIERSIVTIHDLSMLESNSMFDFYGRVATRNLSTYKKCPNVLAISNFTKSQLEKEGFDGDVEVIHHPYSESFYRLDNRDKLRLSLGLPKDLLLVLSVSSGAKRKNLEMVQEVASKLGPEYKLVRVGTDISGAINFHSVSDKVLNDLYNACDVLLFPSLDEGFGFPVIEAFATGLPVVALDIPIMREVVDKYGLLSDPEILDLVSNVRDACSHRGDFSTLSYERSKAFTLQIFKERMERFYQRIMS